MPDITATDLRRLAQYILSAAHQLQHGRLDAKAMSLLSAWNKAAEPLRQDVKEFKGSCADKAAKRAMGMLISPQACKDIASVECTALLGSSDALKNQLADAAWEEAAECITREVIAAYHAALEEGQS